MSSYQGKKILVFDRNASTARQMLITVQDGGGNGQTVTSHEEVRALLESDRSFDLVSMSGMLIGRIAALAMLPST